MKPNGIKRLNISARVREDLVLGLEAKLKELDTRQDHWTKQRVLDGLIEDWLGGKRKVERADATASLSGELLTLQKALDGLPDEQRQNAARMIRALTSTLEGLPQNPSQPRTTPKPKKKAG